MVFATLCCRWESCNSITPMSYELLSTLGRFNSSQVGANPVLEWLRLPGDTLFIVGGVLPILYLSWLSVRHMRPAAKTSEEFKELLSHGSDGTHRKHTDAAEHRHRRCPLWPADTQSFLFSSLFFFRDAGTLLLSAIGTGTSCGIQIPVPT